MKYCILIILVIISSSVFAQEENMVSFKTGIGTYSMKAQKQFQKDYKKFSNLPFAQVHSFPAFPTFGGTISFRTSKRSSIGIWTEFASNGGRLHYQDYSGHILMDQILTSIQGGPFVQYPINQSTTWPFYLTLNGSLVSTREKIYTEIVVSDQLSSQTVKLKALDFGLRPGLMISHKLSPIIIQLGIGYEFQFHKDMTDIKNKDLTIVTSDNKPLIAQWDGLRVNLGIGLGI
jgi:hypothetical protein